MRAGSAGRYVVITGLKSVDEEESERGEIRDDIMRMAYILLDIGGDKLAVTEYSFILIRGGKYLQRETLYNVLFHRFASGSPVAEALLEALGNIPYERRVPALIDPMIPRVLFFNPPESTPEAVARACAEAAREPVPCEEYMPLDEKYHDAFWLSVGYKFKSLLAVIDDLGGKPVPCICGGEPGLGDATRRVCFSYPSP